MQEITHLASYPKTERPSKQVKVSSTEQHE